MSDIGRWLDEHGLGKYTELFVDNEIDFDVLDEITLDELERLGVPLGARKRILKAIGALGTSETTIPSISNEPESASPSGEAERRQLTVMFVDLVGSTALSESMDPEDYREVLAAYQVAASRAITEHGGYIARYMGDGLLVYFGYPAARENDAERAARAGLAVVDAVTALSGPVPLKVRVGIATGPVVVGDIVGEGASEEAAALGETPNLAARLQAAAAPSTVMLSPSTQSLLRGLVETTALGPLELKGFSSPVVPFRALRARSRSEVGEVSHDLRVHVGRDVEIALLERAWQHALAEEGQAVLLSGEPGVGKSRLLQAFKEQLREQTYTMVQWFCSPMDQTTAYYPAIEQLNHSLTIDGDLPEHAVDKLNTLVVQLSLDPEEVVPALALLLSIPQSGRYAAFGIGQQELKRHLISMLVELLLARAKQAPLLFLVEDLHWADPSTLDVLSTLITSIRDHRVLIVMTARPEFECDWEDQTQFSSYRIGRLSRGESTELVRRIAGGRILAPDVAEQIVDRADGVPLFIEEITSSLLDNGTSSAIPTSLHDTLMSRLDRLGEAKEIAQTASVVGRRCSLEELCALAEYPADRVVTRLEQVVDSGLMHRLSGDQYEFKHALVRDAAYESMLRSRRRSLHRRYAAVLEEGMLGDGRPEVIAWHLSQGESHEAAVAAWRRAGETALARSAATEAVAHLRNAVDALDAAESGPDQGVTECEIRLLLGGALTASEGYGSPEGEENFARARALAVALGNTRAEHDALLGLARFSAVHSDLAGALELVDQLLPPAQRLGEREMLADAFRFKGIVLFWMGRLAESVRAYSAGIETQPSRRSDSVLALGGIPPAIECIARRSWGYWLQGLPDKALLEANQAVAWSTDEAHALGKCVALFSLARLFAFRREVERLEEAAERLRDASEQHDYRQYAAQAKILCAWAQVLRGQLDAIGDLEEGISDYRLTGARLGGPYLDSLLACAKGMVGAPGLGLEILDKTVIDSRKRGELWWEAGLHCDRARLLQATDAAADQIRECYGFAIKTARSQGALSLELRAATQLGLFLAGTGCASEVRPLLQPVFDRFNEGFDTPDLRDARKLLSSC